MPRVPGEYEYPDGTTPGKKDGGGWSSNVFDDEGKLQTEATFYPDYDEDDDDHDDEDLAGNLLLAAGLAAALVAGWVANKGLARFKRWRSNRSKSKSDEPQNRIADDEASHYDTAEVALELADPQPKQGATADVAISAPTMSIAEARQRLFEALLARVFADEQFQIVANARIEGHEDSDHQAAIESLRSIPTDEVTRAVNSMLEAGTVDADSVGDYSIMELLGGGGFVNGKYVPVPPKAIRELLRITDGTATH